jgi:tetratricopeptide (TPR) repeat protein
VTFLDNRIHARTGFAWRYPCHERLVPEPGTPDRALTQTRLRVLHAPDPAKSRASYLPLLELAVAERPDDPRCAHYLGREYHALGRHAEAARQFERYFTLTSGPDAFERNATLRLLAHCREAQGDEAGALALFNAAVAEAPRMRGAWISLAWAAHRRQAWPDCLEAAERAISLRDETRNYGEDTSPGVLAEDLACLASWALARPRTALDYARDALAKAPKSERLQANLQRIKAALNRKGPQAFGVSATPLASDGPAKSGALQRRSR